MEALGNHKRRSMRRSRCVAMSVCGVLLGLVVLVVSLVLALRRPADSFKETFISRCEEFKENSQMKDCQNIWSAFEAAYVGRDPCNVPMENYDHLIAVMPLEPACNRMLFWSKTKDLVHDFTEKKDCFMTLEDTLLGYITFGLDWCGKEGSNETITTGCPEWSECENNPVRSFWKRASAAFADVACGDVTAMLNGSIATPFSPSSIFASIEVKGLNSNRVKGLHVVLVTEDNEVTDCTNPSLKDLQKELDPKIPYKCQEVLEAQIQKCMSQPEIPCGACW